MPTGPKADTGATLTRLEQLLLLLLWFGTFGILLQFQDLGSWKKP